MHYYEKNIVEIKNEYTKFLLNLLKPFIFEGFTAIYLEANTIENNYIEKEKINPKVKNPGVLKIFQSLLRDIPNLNDNFIDEETKRIKEKGKCSDFFDDLVRAVIKSFIVLLTYNASDKKCQIVKEKFHESVVIKHFIHKCYIECARLIFSHPQVFWHKTSSLEIKKNQEKALQLIETGIIQAIRKMLPIRLILEEYLNKDYIQSSESENNKNNTNSDIDNKKHKYSNVKNIIRRDLYGKGLNAFQESSSSNNNNDDNDNNNDNPKIIKEKEQNSKNRNNNENSVSSNGILDDDENSNDESNSEKESIYQVNNKVADLDFDKLVLANHEKPNNSDEETLENYKERVNTATNEKDNKDNKDNKETKNIGEENKTLIEHNKKNESDEKKEEKLTVKEVEINSKDGGKFFSNIMKK